MFLENLFEVRFFLDFFKKVWNGIEHNSYHLLSVYCMPLLSYHHYFLKQGLLLTLKIAEEPEPQGCGDLLKHLLL